MRFLLGSRFGGIVPLYRSSKRNGGSSICLCISVRGTGLQVSIATIDYCSKADYQDGVTAVCRAIPSRTAPGQDARRDLGISNRRPEWTRNIQVSQTLPKMTLADA
jgi:hypothetical protein